MSQHLGRAPNREICRSALPKIRPEGAGAPGHGPGLGGAVGEPGIGGAYQPGRHDHQGPGKTCRQAAADKAGAPERRPPPPRGGASLHDSQVAIPLMRLTSERVDYRYDLMDAAYDAQPIYAVSRSLGHVPGIDKNSRGKEIIPLAPPGGGQAQGADSV